MFSAFAHGKTGTLVLLFGLCLLLSGCNKSKVTKENFDKIKNDMTLKEVEDILGEGTREGGDGANIAAQVGVDVTGVLCGPIVLDRRLRLGERRQENHRVLQQTRQGREQAE